MVVSIMNYPPEQKFLRMCYIFLDKIIEHGTSESDSSITSTSRSSPRTIENWRKLKFDKVSGSMSVIRISISASSCQTCQRSTFRSCILTST